MDLKRDKNWFLNSVTYQEMNRLMDLETPFSEEVGQDEFLADFMRPDMEYTSETEELKHLRSAQSVLRDEILTAYAYMEKAGILREYKQDRDSAF